jgi:hypothetical protein
MCIVVQNINEYQSERGKEKDVHNWSNHACKESDSPENGKDNRHYIINYRHALLLENFVPEKNIRFSLLRAHPDKINGEKA